MLLFIPWFRLEAIPLGPLPIQPFGILVATGVITGSKLARWKAMRDGLDPELVMSIASWCLVPGFICAHLFDAIAYHPEQVLADPLFLLRIWEGISSFGGFFGAIAGSYVWSRRRKLPGLAFADPVAFGLPLGWFFGRLGCFSVHDHPGSITDFPLAVDEYRVGYPPFEPRHDLGFYEVIWSAMVVALFLFLGRKRRPAGFYLALLPILYSPVRFGLDFLRATDIDGQDARYFGLTPGHYSAVALLLIGVSVAAFVRKRPWPEIPNSARYVETAPSAASS